MKLSKVRRILTRRLAWLTAKADAEPTHDMVAAERDALRTLLRCQGMLDEAAVAVRIDHVVAVIVPAEQRVKARARRGDELVGLTCGLVDGLRYAARVA